MDISASTGAGGRTMSSYQWDLYKWTVGQTSDTPVAELDYVDNASASGGLSKLIIPAENRTSEREVTWFFNVTATNWLGGVGWKTFEVGGLIFYACVTPRSRHSVPSGDRPFTRITQRVGTRRNWGTCSSIFYSIRLPASTVVLRSNLRSSGFFFAIVSRLLEPAP